MDNSLLAVRDINHKYIVVERIPFMNETTLKIFNQNTPYKKQWKITFLATWIGGMLAHAYRFFNFLPSGILCITLPEPVLLTLPEDVFLNFSVKSLPNMICPGEWCIVPALYQPCKHTAC